MSIRLVSGAVILMGMSTALFAQDSAVEATGQSNSAKLAAPTAVFQPKVAKYSYDAIPKDPLASAFFSATIPGSGQIYNKEYARGITTGVVFYAGFFLAEYELYRWQRLNTDTTYFNETDKAGNTTGQVRAVYVPRDEAHQVGLPTGEKVALATCIVAAAGSWLWGIYDSYTGAKRYNKKLIAGTTDDTGLRLAVDLKGNVALQARFVF